MTTADLPLPRVERDPDDGRPVFFHHCMDERDPEFDRIGGKLPLGPDGWQWQADGSLSPSIECQRCGTHGWHTAAGWRSA